MPEVFGALDGLVDGRQAPALRRQRREGRGGAEGDRVSGRRQRPDHLQHLPPAPGAAVLPRGEGEGRRDHRAGAAGERPADRQDDEGHRTLPPTTTASSTATATPSTSARPSPGVPFEAGLAAVEELRPLVPAGATMAAFALRWILMNEAVTTVIPGAKNAAQAKANAAAAELPPLDRETMAAVKAHLRRADRAVRRPALVRISPPRSDPLGLPAEARGEAR